MYVLFIKMNTRKSLLISSAILDAFRLFGHRQQNENLPSGMPLL